MILNYQLRKYLLFTGLQKEFVMIYNGKEMSLYLKSYKNSKLLQKEMTESIFSIKLLDVLDMITTLMAINSIAYFPISCN